MYPKKLSPQQAKRVLLRERKKRSKRKIKENNKRRVDLNKSYKEKRARNNFEPFQSYYIGDFIKVSVTEHDTGLEFRDALDKYGTSTEFKDHIGMITFMNEKNNTIKFKIVEGKNKEEWNTEEFCLHYYDILKVDNQDEIRERINKSSTMELPEEEKIVTCYVRKIGSINPQFLTRRILLYCINDKNPDSKNLCQISESLITRGQDRKLKNNSYIGFVWSTDILQNLSFQPVKESNVELLSNITTIIDRSKEDPVEPNPYWFSIETKVEDIKLFTEPDSDFIEIEEKLKNKLASNKDLYQTYQKFPTLTELELSEDNNTDLNIIYKNLYDNRFLLTPFSLFDIEEYNNYILPITKDDNIRVLNMKKSRGKKKKINIKNYIATVIDVYPDSEQVKIKIGSTNYKLPLNYVEKLVPWRDYSLLYSSIENEEYKKKWLSNKLHREQIANIISTNIESLDTYAISKTSTEVYKEFLDKNSDKDLFLKCNVDYLNPSQLYFYVPEILIESCAYEPPRLHKHNIFLLQKTIQDACNKSENPYRFDISYNWPPKSGDTVYILGGLYKGMTGTLLCIQRGFGISKYGEAIILIDGLFQEDSNIMSPWTEPEKHKPFQKYIRTSVKHAHAVKHSISLTYVIPLPKGAKPNSYLDIDNPLFKVNINLQLEDNYQKEWKYQEWKPTHYLFKENEYVSIIKGEYKGFVGLIKKIEVEERVIHTTLDAEKAWNIGILKEKSSKLVKSAYPKNSIRMGVQYYFTLEIPLDMYKQVCENLHKDSIWIDQIMEDKESIEGKQFKYLIVPYYKIDTPEMFEYVTKQQETEPITENIARSRIKKQLLALSKQKAQEIDVQPLDIVKPMRFMTGHSIQEISQLLKDEPQLLIIKDDYENIKFKGFKYEI